MIQTGNRNGFTCYRQADKTLRHRMDLTSNIKSLLGIIVFHPQRFQQCYQIKREGQQCERADRYATFAIK
jgi:hypothetical protein